MTMATPQTLESMANNGTIPPEGIAAGEALKDEYGTPVITKNGDGYSIDTRHPLFDTWKAGPYYVPYTDIHTALDAGLKWPK